MLEIFKKYILPEKKKAGSNSNGDLNKKVQVATCALLFEMAKIDDDFSLVEKKTIEEVLKKDLGIKEESVKEIMDRADKVQSESIDIWQFTNLINEHYSKEDKLKIVKLIWKVVYADSKLDMYEDHLIHKLANLLHLSHKELIEAKLKVKNEK